MHNQQPKQKQMTWKFDDHQTKACATEFKKQNKTKTNKKQMSKQTNKTKKSAAQWMNWLEKKQKQMCQCFLVFIMHPFCFPLCQNRRIKFA